MGMTWTEEQKRVIDSEGKDILVSAAAGSGKTAVLVERIIRKITDQAHPVDIDRLLVVTFTHAAAAEMKERIAAALDERLAEDPENILLERQSSLLRSAQITTIHSFCLYVIRNHFNEIDLDPSFRIADEMELALIRSDLMDELLEEQYAQGSEDFLEFVECYAKGKTDDSIETMISQIYDYSRSYPWPSKWLDACMDMLDAKDSESFNALPLICFLKDYIRHILGDLRAQIEEARKLCADPDGPVFYDEALADDLSWILRLENCTDFDECRQIAGQLKWRALSRKKMPEADQSKKTRVKAIRDNVKSMTDRLKKDFFFADESSMIADLRKTVRPMGVLIRLVKAFSEKYRLKKEEKNMVDFNDLEHFALDILLKQDEEGHIVPSAAAAELRNRFEEVMCDEYQDSNLVQETLLAAVSGEHSGRHNRFMVGDVKQSIYKFRLARPELFMEKYKEYPPYPGDASSVRIDLHKNFRSRDCVVDFVNLIFEHVMGEALGGIVYDEDAKLKRGASFPEEKPTQGYTAAVTQILIADLSEAEEANRQMDFHGQMTAKEWEAKMIAAQIRKMMDGGMMVADKKTGAYRPLAYGDIVILLRTMSGWADSFSSVLESEHIPVHAEVSAGFFDTPEIRTFVCFLSIIDNPLQDIALAAVMKSCLFNFSDEALAMIRSISKNTSFYQACLSFTDKASDGLLETYYTPAQYEPVRRQIEQMIGTLEHFRRCVFYMPIHKLILKIYEETGYYHLVSAMPMGQKRQANLDMLVAKAVDYEKTSYKGLFNFVRYIRRLETYDVDMGEASVFSENEDAVRLMSIHKSKGLEYPVVFVSGLSKKFNQQDARSSLLMHSEYGLGPEAVDEQARIKSPTILKKAMAHLIMTENLSEELRVLYVALSRAKEMLILTGTVDDPRKSYDKWRQISMNASDLLAYSDLCTAGSYLDWVMPVLLKEDFYKKSKAKVNIRMIGVSQMLRQKTEQMISSHMLRQQLALTDQSLLSDEVQKTLDDQLSWQYPYEESVTMHAKMTVSELKQIGAADDEVPEDDSFVRHLVEESTRDMLEESGMQISDQEREARMAAAAKRGTAVHKLMELLDFETITDIETARQFIGSVRDSGRIDGETADRISPWLILRFCTSPLGRRMAKANRCHKLYRETQFMIGVPACEVSDVRSREMILIQGVIDACFEEDGQIILVEYKTDFVKEGNEEVLIRRYEKQLYYYEKAIEQLTGRKVSEKYIYSFALNRPVSV